MHQHYHLQRIFVCVRTKLVILLGETPNLPSPNQHEYSIASLRAQQKTAPVPGGFTCSFKAATAPKKKYKMMLEFHRDAGAACTKAIFFSSRERHCTHLGQKVSARANHRLTEIASHSRCSSVRPETQGKEGEICCYLKGVKNLLWGEVDKKREEKFFSHCRYRSQEEVANSSSLLQPEREELKHGPLSQPMASMPCYLEPQPTCLWVDWVLQSSAKLHFHILHRPHHLLSVAAWTHASLTQKHLCYSFLPSSRPALKAIRGSSFPIFSSPLVPPCWQGTYHLSPSPTAQRT